MEGTSGFDLIKTEGGDLTEERDLPGLHLGLRNSIYALCKKMREEMKNMGRYQRRGVGKLVFLAVAMVMLYTTVCAARTIYVGPSETYKTIQAGINAFRGGEAGTLIVRNGDYSGPGNYNLTIVRKPLTIQSEGLNPADCRIDCTGNNGFYMYACVTGGITIEGFTIKNAAKGIMIDTQAKATVKNCIIENNVTGIWCSHYAAASPSDCIIRGNTVGIDLSCNASPTIARCSITDNGTGIKCASGPRPLIDSCQILNNTGCGVLCTSNSAPAIQNVTATGNQTGMSFGWSCSPSITGCRISANTADGLACNNASSPAVTNCEIIGNGAAGIRMTSSCSPRINNCNISDNVGGGINCSSGCAPVVNACDISGNGNTAINGGGIFCTNSCSPVITNCVIDSNMAAFGGGINCQFSGTATFTNCTLYGNFATNGAGLRCGNSAIVKVTNCIIWDESPREILVETAGNPQVAYSNVFNYWPGLGNIFEDPLFVNPAGGNFRLQEDSLCVDAGTDTAPSLPAADKDGNPRLLGWDVDMGAYECY